MRNWLEDLASNQKALEKVEHILNHTLCNEDGDSLFPSIHNLAELYTILFVAYTAGKDGLDDHMSHVKNNDDSAIAGVTVGAVHLMEDEDRFWFLKDDDKKSHVRIYLY